MKRLAALALLPIVLAIAAFRPEWLETDYE